MKLEAKEITAATGGWVEKLGEAVVAGVSVDSRTIRKGDVFFALRGPNFDGHSFLEEALAGGAAGLVVKEKADVPARITAAKSEKAEQDFFLIRVSDTIKALGDLAADYRRKFGGKVVAVTGSNGKTTTKEMIASILGVRWKVARSPGNFNNLIGVPLSIFMAEEKHQALVLEAGMNRPGEIKRLTDIASPDIGIITSIAPAHLERTRSINGIKRAKGELLDRMKSNATAVLNADDPNVIALVSRFKGKIMTFGIRPGADVWADKMVARVDGGTSFDLVTGEGKIRITLHLLGLHNIYNALAAAASCVALNFNLREIQRGLTECQPLDMRLELIDLPGKYRIVNDAYNANPGSVRAAVETFLALVARGRRHVVLGDMLELGTYSSQAHQEIGRFIAEKGVDTLVTVGEESQAATKAFNKSAGAGQKGLHFKDLWEAAKCAVGEMRQGDITLVKGSRGMTLENVVQAMIEMLGSIESESGGC